METAKSEFSSSATAVARFLGHSLASAFGFVGLACWRRSKFDPPCRLNFDPGLGAGIG